MMEDLGGGLSFTSSAVAAPRGPAVLAGCAAARQTGKKDADAVFLSLSPARSRTRLSCRRTWVLGASPMPRPKARSVAIAASA